MPWCLKAICTLLTTSVTALSIGFATASAEPGQTPSCNYTLSPPQLAVVSGVTMVTATLTPLPCTGKINPNSMTVCLKTQGSDAAPMCASEARPIAAQVFVPHRVGATYESTGRGCGSSAPGGASTEMLCSTGGPYTATF